MHASATLLPGKNSSTHLTIRWVATKDGLKRFVEEKILCVWRDSNSGPSIQWRSRYTNYAIPIPLANLDVLKKVRISSPPTGLSAAQRRKFKVCWSENDVSVFWYITPHQCVIGSRRFETSQWSPVKGSKRKRTIYFWKFRLLRPLRCLETSGID
jgi:hypothetical protein